MEKIKLKPCPFCGEKPKLYDVPEHGYQIALCECSCGSAFAGGKTAEEAAEKWNRRAPEWFSVDKVLPADWRACLIATAEGWAVAGYCGNGEWVLDYDELNIECEVTRWRELPDDWVDAGEKLPPEDEDKKAYLVKVGGNVTIAEYHGDGEWMTYSLCNVTRLVTHWQPLPEAPLTEVEDETVVVINEDGIYREGSMRPTKVRVNSDYHKFVRFWWKEPTAEERMQEWGDGNE